MSDIHGHYTELMQTLKRVDLKSKENKLVFLGDYVDNGRKSFQVLNEVMLLEKKYPTQIITLLGNHDEWFYNWLFDKEPQFNFNDFFETINSFIGTKSYSKLVATVMKESDAFELDNLIRQKILQSPTNRPLLNWFTQKYQAKRYYITANQIFVHAGIDENAGDYWESITASETFTNKYPPTTGKFLKTIISGHVYSDEVAQNANYLGKIFWDRESHFFIDGHTDQSHVIPLLKYDTQENIYSSYKLISDHTWQEYIIDPKS
ncbi:MAG: metallophosphoesterase [Liquorilactobacillus ghanensis]